jgi:hypothetical protein
MKKVLNTTLVLVAALSLVGCFNKNQPNYQYMPNMYEPVGYETYGEYGVFENDMEAKLPAQGSIPRGYQPYDYPDTNEGREMARAELKMTLPVTQENLDRGKELYGIYCAVCHGDKGDGKGILMQREKILGIPSYADPGRVINEGGTYHAMMYGLNSMGSYASQTNELERWQITQHVMNLKAALLGEAPLPMSTDQQPTLEATDMAAQNQPENEQAN